MSWGGSEEVERRRVEIGAPGGIMPPFEKVIQQAQRAEAKGYDAVWWPCHLMGWHPQAIWRPEITPLAQTQPNADIYFDPVATVAAVGVQTTRIRLGIGVTDVIRRHPAMLAQAALTLDHITRGRVILGLGSGERLNITPYGLDFDQPVSRLEEGLEIIRRLWGSGGRPVDFEGRFWHLESAVLGLQPYEGRCPPIWIAAHGPRMLRLTGRYADGWLPTKMTPAEYSEKLAQIHRAAREAGRDPAAITPGMLAYVLVDEDRAAVAHMMEAVLVKALCLLLPAEVFRRFGYEPPFGPGVSGFHDYIPARFGYEEAMTAIRKVPREIVAYFTLHGTPGDIAEQIWALAKAGLRHVVLWNITPFADPARARASFQALDRVKELVSGSA
ncbi:MAG: LLM class flavin-dependent oxidoreductase [Blastocatellia bacterium]|nr:LLM class flavin-dependent oxidoreductase [Blastocatellia bacterium]MCS7156137.1 LLM class flavin-dependent oxidoreductase [Blastocatellia bacterium]MDW8169225.1 LLM class flavin-dependent oxidoreductase [Acidobacteriota bacterium]MDW8256085.1 LLM class flavin-dependent oxidoreductase [Acidobacteriota bacterium]